MDSKYFFAVLIFGGIILIGILTFALTPVPEESPSNIEAVRDEGTTTKTASAVGGPFSLVDHNGQDVTEQDYAGKYKLIFFGFTHCPGICPGELNKISAVLDLLGEQAQDIQPLFISIDPERDTPEEMKEYVGLFDDRIIGLTGTPAQIEQVKNDYKIYASKMEMKGAMAAEGNYMMDHSTYTYLMTPDNELLLVFNIQDTAEDISVEIKSHF